MASIANALLKTISQSELETRLSSLEGALHNQTAFWTIDPCENPDISVKLVGSRADSTTAGEFYFCKNAAALTV